MLDKLRCDPVGNGVSTLVLVGMVVSVVLVTMMKRCPPAPTKIGASFPVVAAIGIGAAAYLTYVETSGATAVCGPVGDCNAVQQSPYAVLFVVIPIRAAGLAGYTALISAWIVSRASSGPISEWAKLSVLGMTVAGTLSSIYVTFLEPFVIGATCVWCLTSAVAITLLMWVSAGPGKRAWLQLYRAGPGLPE